METINEKSTLLQQFTLLSGRFRPDNNLLGVSIDIPDIDTNLKIGEPYREDKMALVVKVNNGRVEEYENGCRKRSYGSNVIAASSDGNLIAAVTKGGRIEEYVNGIRMRSYGSNAVGVKVSGGTVAVLLSNGRTEEYVNGCRRRSY